MATWPPDETIWPQVQRHRWKYAPRAQPVRLILIHATRGRVRMALQYPATINWQVSPNNKVVEESGAVWGSMSSRIISHEGQLCISVPDEYHPTWSAGHMDPIAISYELAQPSWQSAFTPACLERAALEVAKDCLRFDIPPVVLPYVSGDNHEAPGIARHDRSANGRKWGKSDPGKMFDDRAFEARVRYHMETLMPEKTLTREQYINICKAEDQHAEEARRKVRQWLFAVMGWPWPKALK